MSRSGDEGRMVEKYRLQRERLALHETEVGPGSSDGEGAPCEREAKQSRRPDPLRLTSERAGGPPKGCCGA